MSPALWTLLLAASIACVACAGNRRPAVAQATVDVSAADALFEAGCYRCLEQAFGIYDRARTSARPPAGVAQKAFATALLLALREKELGLAATPWLDTASSLATPIERPYLEMAAVIPWESAGAPDFDPPRRPSAMVFEQWRAFLQSSSLQPVLDRYLLTAFTCSLNAFGGLRRMLNAIDAQHPAVRYRIGACGSDRRRDLESVRSSDPRWVEASFFLGRYEMGAAYVRPDWLTRAIPLLTAAHEGVPESPVVTVTLAGALRARFEPRRALTLYDEALALRPTQRDALLGRTITLTTLGENERAIAVASEMIALGTWYVGDAHYWRAWNHYQRRDLERAAADVAEARKLLRNTDVLTLAGIVAYEQQRRADARRDFDEAHRMRDDNCTAQWYLGLLNVDDEAWPAALEMFTLAADCHGAAAESLEAEIEQLPADVPKEARQDYQRRMADSLRQAARSAFNAAQASLRTGDRPGAFQYARRAAVHPDLKERADALIRSLEAR